MRKIICVWTGPLKLRMIYMEELFLGFFFDVFLGLSKMIPNELPDVGLRLEFIDHSYSF